jgi:hypothetical protein
MRYAGPFKVLQKVGPVAYKLQLPESCQVHDVFHVSLLKEYRQDGRHQPPPAPLVADDGGLEFEVEKLLLHRIRKRGKTEFLVKWLGYPAEHNTWEPLEGMSHCMDLVQEYWAQHPVEDTTTGPQAPSVRDSAERASVQNRRHVAQRDKRAVKKQKTA